MNEPRPEVLLIGFGAVGALYAYILQKGGANVTAVCRSNYEVVRERGIDIVSAKLGEERAWRPTRVVQSPDDVEQGLTFDYVVCCTKYVPDIRTNSEVLRPFLAQNKSRRPAHLPAVVLLQNGIDIEQDSYEAFVDCTEPMASCIISANTWVPATLTQGGARMEHGRMERLSIGVFPAPLDHPLPDATQRVLDTFLHIAQRGGSDASITNDIAAGRWHKVVWNISWGGVCLLSRRSIAEILQVDMLPYTVGSVRGIMLEMLAVARAAGLGEDRLPARLLDDTIRQTLCDTPAKMRLSADPERFSSTPRTSLMRPEFKPSILVDLERQRPMELEPIFGNILRVARRVGVDTPRLDLIVTAVRPTQLEYVRKQGGMDHSSMVAAEGVYDTLPSLNATGCVPVGLLPE